MSVLAPLLLAAWAASLSAFRSPLLMPKACVDRDRLRGRGEASFPPICMGNASMVERRKKMRIISEG